MQPARGAPYAEAVVHKQLDARGPCIGEEVAVVGPGLPDGVDNNVEHAVSAGAHVLWLGAQPQGVDADHGGHPQKTATVSASARSRAAYVDPALAAHRNSTATNCSGGTQGAAAGIAASMRLRFCPAIGAALRAIQPPQ